MALPVPARCPPTFRTRVWPGLLLYFVVVAVLQMAASPTAELDQAEQLILSQRLQWGYTNQPPLYTWVIWALSQVGGVSLGLFYLVKVGLLALLTRAFAGVGEELGFSACQHALALSGLAWLPAFVWEAQRDLTHSMMAATLAAMMLWATLVALRRQRLWDHALIGLAAGGALLSKQNALIFVLAVLLTVVSLPAWRQRLQPAGLVMALLCAVLVCVPHAVWLLSHGDALSRTTQKVIAHGEGGWAAHTVSPVLALGEGLASFLLPWLLLAWPLCRRAGVTTEAARFMGRLAALVLGLLLAFVVLAGVGEFKARWLFPILFFAPLWLAASVGAQTGRLGLWMVWGGVAWAVLCGGLLAARIVWPLPGAALTRQNLPFAPLAEQLRTQWGAPPTLLLASNHHVGGNLRLAWPTSTEVLTPLVNWPVPSPREAHLVWAEQDLRDPRFAHWLQANTGLTVPQLVAQGQVSAPLLHRPLAPPYRLSWARVPLRPEKDVP